MFSRLSTTRRVMGVRGFAMVSKPALPASYGNFINGKFEEPIDGQYFDNVSPIDGQPFIKAARSNQKDINMAVDSASEALKTWKNVSVTERSNMLLKIADIIEQNAETLATLESMDNGKAIRETVNADLPLVVDHFRYFAGVIRADEGSASEIDADTLSMIIHEPLGVVGLIIPWNFPLLMAAWKLAPALAAGNTMVLKPAEQTPTSIMYLMNLLKDVIPAGVVNVVTGFGEEAGEALTSNKKVAKLAFTGETNTGKLIMKKAADNLVPVSMELGGKSPNIFFSSIADEDDALFDKAIEGAVLFAFNQGEVCTCQSRILIQEDIYDKFIERMIARVNAIKIGHPLDTDSMMGAQVSKDQYERIQNYCEIGKKEGAEVLTGGANNDVIDGGYYIKPTVLKGTNDMRVFQEEIFGPVTSVTTFKTEEEAIAIANDTVYGLGAGVWSRDGHQMYQVARQIEAGRVWVNCYHLYPAHAPFGGYKQSGFGRETHKMMLDAFRQTKNMLVSYNKNKLGFF